MIYITIVFLLAFLTQKSYGQENSNNTFTHTPSVYYHFEQGVTNRLSLQNIASFENKSLTYSAGWRFHLNEQIGLGSFSLALNEWRSPKQWLSFGAEYQYHEYPDFDIGENQLALLSYFKTGEKVRLGAGLTYRSPHFTDDNIHSPFVWGGTIDELYFVFQVKWNIIKKDKYMLITKMGSYDFMQIQTMDYFFFKLENTFKLKENVNVIVNMSTALKGFSSLLFAINEFRLNAGLSFYY